MLLKTTDFSPWFYYVFTMMHAVKLDSKRTLIKIIHYIYICGEQGRVIGKVNARSRLNIKLTLRTRVYWSACTYKIDRAYAIQVREHESVLFPIDRNSILKFAF